MRAQELAPRAKHWRRADKPRVLTFLWTPGWMPPTTRDPSLLQTNNNTHRVRWAASNSFLANSKSFGPSPVGASAPAGLFPARTSAG